MTDATYIETGPAWWADLARLEVETPALLLDLDALDRNIAAAAGHARAAGVGLRPHAKTHKCAAIGRRQMEAGALGLCCAKLSEAEALADAGLARLAITAPVVDPVKLARLAALANRIEELIVVVDDPAMVAPLARAAAAAERPLATLVDLDVGQHRTGAPGIAELVDLARRVDAAPALRYAGLQGYAGHIQHIPAVAARTAAAREVSARMAEAVAALGEAGLAPAIVTGGGTGSFAIDADSGVFTEMQIGSYFVMDDEYFACERVGPRFERAGTILAQVVSCRHPGAATIDCGSKSLSFDGPLPSVPAPRGLAYARAGDEFGRVEGPEAALPALAERVMLGLPHCDPTINLFDRFVCIEGGAVAGAWDIEARGRSQ